MTKELDLSNPIDLAVILMAIDNYARDFNEYLKTSNDRGFISDDAISASIKSIVSQLSDIEESK